GLEAVLVSRGRSGPILQGAAVLAALQPAGLALQRQHAGGAAQVVRRTADDGGSASDTGAGARRGLGEPQRQPGRREDARGDESGDLPGAHAMVRVEWTLTRPDGHAAVVY